MTTPCEYTLAEKPTMDGLIRLGWSFLSPDLHNSYCGDEMSIKSLTFTGKELVLNMSTSALG